MDYAGVHWMRFVDCPRIPQGAFGKVPSKWVRGLVGGDEYGGLPEAQMTRAQVRAVCQDHSRDVAYGYICAMAWGMQRNLNGYRDAAWKARDRFRDRLERLRNEELTHREPPVPMKRAPLSP